MPKRRHARGMAIEANTGGLVVAGAIGLGALWLLTRSPGKGGTDAVGVDGYRTYTPSTPQTSARRAPPINQWNVSGTIADTAGKTFADVRGPIALVNPYIALYAHEAKKFWLGATRKSLLGIEEIQIETFTYFSLWQGARQVYGSGVAVQKTWLNLNEASLKGAPVWRVYLVAPDQLQPDGRKAPELAAYPYGAPEVTIATPICNGGPPVPTVQGGALGEGTIGVYGRFTAADGPDGTASPSCTGRVPIFYYWGKMRWDFVFPGNTED